MKLKIFKFDSPSQFLSVYFVNKKSYSVSWSYQKWSTQLGMSKADLVRAVSGKRAISRVQEKKFAQYFKFNEKESEYFAFMVMLDRLSKNQKDQLPLRDLLNRKFAELDSTIDLSFSENARVLLDWDVRALLTWLQKNSKSIKSVIDGSDAKMNFHQSRVPTISDEQVLTLQQLGVVEVDAAGVVHLKKENFKISSEMLTAAEQDRLIISNLQILIQILNFDIKNNIAADHFVFDSFLKTSAKSVEEIGASLKLWREQMVKLHVKEDGDTILYFHGFGYPVATSPKE